MKIEVTKRGTNAFYQEFMYVYFRYNYLKKKPYKKAYNITNYFLVYMVFVVFELIIMSLLYLNSKDNFYLIFIGVFGFLMLYLSFLLININRQIKVFKNDPSKKIIEINKKGISYEDSNKLLKLDWDDISSVIINKYTICFLPKTNLQALISINMEYKDKVLEEIYKQEKDNLVVNNNKK